MLRRVMRSISRGFRPPRPTGVLQTWESEWDKGNFPIFTDDSHWLHGAARLVVFRSEQDWVTIFQWLIFRIGMHNFDQIVYAYGSSVTPQGLQDFAPPLECGLQLPADNEGVTDDWCPDPHSFAVIVRGHLRIFSPTRKDYEQVGLSRASLPHEDDCLDNVARVFRYLCLRLPPNDLFCPIDYLLQGLELPPSLELFTVINAWDHPDGQSVSRPRDSRCLSSISAALKAGDISLVMC